MAGDIWEDNKELIRIESRSQLFLGWHCLTQAFCCLAIALGCWFSIVPTAQAALDNDRLDGNIFVIYAGNGSLVPTNETVAQAQSLHRPVMLVFYVDDSKDCKEFAITVSRVQEAYGRRASILPINVDSLTLAEGAIATDPTKPQAYYKGGVPQIVILDQEGQVQFDHLGVVPFETIDVVFRNVFDLAAPSPAEQLQRRAYNEFNTELAP